MNKGRKEKEHIIVIAKDPKGWKIIKKVLLICSLGCFTSIQGKRLLPNYNLYKNYYSQLNVYLVLLFLTIFLICGAVVFLSINEINLKVMLLAFNFLFTVVILDYGIPYAFNDDSAAVAKYNIVSWIKDFKYVSSNNPPCIVDNVKIDRYQDVRSGKYGSRSIRYLAFLKIDKLTFNVRDEGSMKITLDNYKKGDKVKIYYLPNTNRLLSINLK